MRKNTVLLASYIALVALVAFVLHALSNPENLPVVLVVVEGRSMIPTLWTGDVVLVVKKPADSIRVGDIIVYKAISDGHLVIHRVVKVNRIAGTYYYVTRGDNNILPDNMMPSLEPILGIPYERVVGVVLSFYAWGSQFTVRLPLLGYLSILVSELVSR